MGITATLSLAAQALKVAQLAIQTTGHNLANVGTPGFSRQRVDLVSAPPSYNGGVFIGQGVNTAGVSRVVDSFAEAELLSLNGEVGYSDTQSRALNSIQEAFPLTGGVNGALSELFGALSDLANNPASLTERVSVIGKARALGDTLVQTRQIMTSLQRDLDQDLGGATQRVNVLTEQIAGLNNQIAFNEVRGETANDFRDRRQSLLHELVALTGATVRESDTGQVTVTADGLLLVANERFATLSSAAVASNGLHEVTYQGPDGTAFDATTLLKGGKIGSLLNTRDTQVEGIIGELDLFAKTMVDEFNSQHALGYDLTGAGGGNLFTPIAVTAGAAANVTVATALAADPRLLAAAATPAALPGDNRNALALVGLRGTAIAGLGGQTFEDRFLSLVGNLGSQAQAAQSRLDFQQALLIQTQSRRESVSGVNLDEEAVKLIQFQRAFEASSMLVRTADEMYQSLIDMVR